ncbi:MAG: aminotransferase class III-fold pyridoxal phosphate-dependent enzyme [Candidatus Marinimicrobia bacterium]|nr:aminotransferase class III-fold pyridoxal phosphate-dependent enzyme [Candidatus Neomarinimicrobiota bacterium]
MMSIDLFDTQAAERVMREAYGIEGKAKQLAGEYDLNFAIRAGDQRWLLKIARVEAAREEVEFQNLVLEHVFAHLDSEALPVQRVLPDRAGQRIVELATVSGVRLARVLSYLDGRMLASVTPHFPELLVSLGATVARVDRALGGFSHPLAEREFKWNLTQSDGMLPKLENIRNPGRRAIAARHLETFVKVLKPRLAELPRGVIHGDANDYNIVVTGSGREARVSGLIDFGDAMDSPMVCGLAIALAYAMLGKADPIASAAHVVRGYHAVRPLSDLELELLYPLALTRLAVSVTNSATEQRLRPDDPYIIISEAPAWALLEKLETIHTNYPHYVFRAACGLEPVPNSTRVRNWLTLHQERIGPVVEADFRSASLEVLDLSVCSLDLGLADETNTTEKFVRWLKDRLERAGKAVGIGRYGEARLCYRSEDFKTLGENGPEDRTVHLGLDVFMAAGSVVRAPLAGVVHGISDNRARLDYGPCVILEHRVDDGQPLVFHTLYGHLSAASLERLEVGQRMQQGDLIGGLGEAGENGDWPPHLHFQLIAELLGMEGTFPGVARPSDRAVWQSLSPDPNLITRIPSRHFPSPPMSGAEIGALRRDCIGRNLSISYRQPVNIVRGVAQYLYDEHGQRYLDCYNNVPHVGHGHPRVVRAVQRQMAVLNTNTRYLHEILVRYAKRLTATLPAPLSVCYFVSSGSEATELALRLAQAHTGQRDLIVSDHAYHGNTGTLIDISPYKAEGPGGHGLPDWVHKAQVPDDYRGPFKRGEANVGERYAAGLDSILANIHRQGRGLRGFIIESIQSVGGQIVLPEGYLKAVYQKVRAAGGVCIADEVQTGFGRIGSHFWGFEHQGVVPDIVAMGKPMGNGHPLAAVVTTPEIAASFDNGMEFFATFGGSPVSCAAGIAVLDVIEDEKLQDHALELGRFLMDGLRALQQQHAVIGDVRGLGLFNGLELVRDRETRVPAPQQTAYVVNRLRDFHILTGTDGPHHNVIKLRGPMVLTKSDVDEFLPVLDRILREDAAQA